MVYGPDLKIPYAATAFVTKRSVIAKRPQVIGNFMRAMAETAKIMHTDREFVYKVLGKYLRLTDRSVLDSAYNAEIKVLEPRLVIKTESLQAILDEAVGDRSSGQERQTAGNDRQRDISMKWKKADFLTNSGLRNRKKEEPWKN